MPGPRSIVEATRSADMSGNPCDAERVSARMETPAQPSVDVQRAFGASGIIERFASGEGSTFRVGDRVLKPAADAHEAEWVGDVLDDITENGFRLARPVRSSDGAWVYDGWTAWEWIEGLATTERWEDIITAGRRFHRALHDVPRPDFLSQRTHQWSIGDRVAFGEQHVSIPAPIDEQVQLLLRPLGESKLASQVVHGDLTENVLIAVDHPPAIIDFSPYYRPVGYASAIVAVDAVVWFGAPLTIIDSIGPAEARMELLARALIFRLVATALHAVDDTDRLRAQAHAHSRLVDHVSAVRDGR
jgi:uncharacterized protein (TIGR02569 family)